MFIALKSNKITFFGTLAIFVAAAAVLLGIIIKPAPNFYCVAETENGQQKKFIKWVQFKPTYEVLEQALNYDIRSQSKPVKLNWIELLAYAAAKNGGKFSSKQNADIDKLARRLQAGESIDEITKDMKYYPYYKEAYTAVLGGFVGKYSIETDDPQNPGQKKIVEKYGLKVFSPIARGYGFSHSSDFGVKRSYGYSRPHLGNDMFGSVGTPIIAVETGVVEELGWNRYGGWRIGIRSLDSKRYYYYAHLRKGHPYNSDIKIGKQVTAGDVIGYLGMTGYSIKEDVNNMTRPHLHFGMQLIFDESQKEGNNEIWIDVYSIVKLLQKNRSRVAKDEQTKEYHRVYQMYENNGG